MLKLGPAKEPSAVRTVFLLAKKVLKEKKRFYKMNL